MKWYEFILVILAALGVALGIETAVKSRTQSAPVYVETPEPLDNPAPTHDWDAFVEALIWVESRGDENAMGRHNDGGVLQITPIYIAEANAIIGSKGHYTVGDRFDRDKSIEIFNVMNAYHNPERDIEKAIRLHNPKAPESYRTKVLTKYNEILKTYGKSN